jgi:Putative DNA-binding domain
MLSLAEFQTCVRRAVIGGNATSLLPFLFGGLDSEKRFAIHRRHYEASLVRALVEKFPAVNWLVGSPLLTDAARAFVRCRPPSAPCIAEYGEDFPDFLAAAPGTAQIPWIRWVGELELHIGHAARAVEEAPIASNALAAMNADRLPDFVLRLQPGLRYLAAPWPVDDLLKLFLSEAAPERFELAAQDVFLEIRGSRGAFSIARLKPGVSAFRQAIAAGQSIGIAAERAIETDPSFDPGRALAALLAEGLAVQIMPPRESNYR